MKTIATLLITCLSASLLSAFEIPVFGKTADTAASAAETVQSAADISKSLNSSLDMAKSAVGGDNPGLTSLLSNIGKQAASGNDLSMLQSLSGLAGNSSTKSLTGGQKELLTEVTGHAQALALARNFSGDPNIEGPVSQAIKAVQTRDKAAAVSSLKDIASKGSLSDQQTQLIKAMLGDYGKYLDTAKQASGAANALKNLF